MTRTEQRRRGFSLIEAAIVLGVVGLVIGGIWVSASAMYENYKVNKTVRDVLLIIRNVQYKFSVADIISIGYPAYIAHAAKEAGVFPKDWISGSKVVQPFSSEPGCGGENDGNVQLIGYLSPERIDLALCPRVPPSACTKILMRVSAIVSKPGNSGYYGSNSLGYISVSGSYISTFPIPLETAKAVCQDNDRITFGFGLTRIN